MDIPKELAKFRNKKGLTQEEIAEKLDISLSYYQKIEQGKKCKFQFYQKIQKRISKLKYWRTFFKQVS